jgi:hypothetical protein
VSFDLGWAKDKNVREKGTGSVGFPDLQDTLALAKGTV